MGEQNYIMKYISELYGVSETFNPHFNGSLTGSTSYCGSTINEVSIESEDINKTLSKLKQLKDGK